MDTTSVSSSYIANILLLCFLIFEIMPPKFECSLRVPCNEKDHHLLLNFKHSVVDPYEILSSWSDERDCCEWTGVHCDNTTGRVIELTLPCSGEYTFSPNNTCEGYESYCLKGELHLAYLLHLESLNYLDLSHNEFQAIILNDIVEYCPRSCQNFSHLHHLDLSYNEHVHVDNLHWLSCLPSLELLSLSAINLVEKVDWIQLPSLIPSIKKLYFDSCQLKNINPSLQYVNLTSLEIISFSDNTSCSLLPRGSSISVMSFLLT